ANALELARQGRPANPFYLTGQVGGQPLSVHAEGERVILTGSAGRQEIDLVPPAAANAAVALPEPVCPAGGGGADPEGAEPAPGVGGRTGVPREARPPQTRPADRSKSPGPGGGESHSAAAGGAAATATGGGQPGGEAAGSADPGSAGRRPHARPGGPGVGRVAAPPLRAGAACRAGAAGGLRAR